MSFLSRIFKRGKKDQKQPQLQEPTGETGADFYANNEEYFHQPVNHFIHQEQSQPQEVQIVRAVASRQVPSGRMMMGNTNIDPEKYEQAVTQAAAIAARRNGNQQNDFNYRAHSTHGSERADFQEQQARSIRPPPLPPRRYD